MRDALGACRELNPVYRWLIKLALQNVQVIEQQIDQLDQEIASLLHDHQERGPTVSEQSKRIRTARMIRTLQMLGYRVELSGNPA